MVTYSQSLAIAIQLAVNAHDMQMNKDGTPYITHPLRLMMAAKDDSERIVAILHDTLEDTNLTEAQLRVLPIPEHCVDAVVAMSKVDGEDYEAFIERIGLDPLATAVKLLDLKDNIDLTRLAEVGEYELKRAAKYHRAIKRLKHLQNVDCPFDCDICEGYPCICPPDYDGVQL